MSEKDDDIIIENFIDEIRVKFPEVLSDLDEWMELQGYEPEDRMYTSLMERFSQITTDSFKNKNEDRAKSYLEYMSRKLVNATDMEKEYIDVYYVESLMWDDFSGERRKKCWEFMPKNLQSLYLKCWGRKTYDEKEL
ncbi:MAG: hypothetical protein LJE96_04630 [Deltaproteobacteria bacterium]|nr:hypothetical protein [Deltaproteobacteria bacterium]